MILHLSRGFILGSLSAIFAVGGAAGYLFRSSVCPSLADAPALSRPVEMPVVPPTIPDPTLRASRAADLRSVPTPGASYRLGEKDTLRDVCMRAYGSTKRLADLVAANPSVDPRRLQAGTVIYVPAVPDAGASRSATSTPSKPRVPSSDPAPVFAKPK